MYFSGDFNVLDPAFGIGSFGEGDEPHLEVPKVPSEGQEESDEWVLPERAYGNHDGEEGVSHEQEDEGIPVEVTAEQDVAPEVEESTEGYKEPHPTPSEEDPFADNSADTSAAEVEAQLELSNEEQAKGEETTETAAEGDEVVDGAPMEKAQEGPEAVVVVEKAEAVISTEVSGEDAVEEEGKRD
jgi:hypothetical protein